MKQYLFIFALLLGTISMCAEPTFLHRFGEEYGYFNVRSIYDYDTYTSNYYTETSYTELYPSNSLYYFWKEDFRNKQTGTYTMHFYDENFNELTPFVFNIPYLKGYNIYSFAISNATKHFFNDDDNWEYIVQYEWTDSLRLALKDHYGSETYKNQKYRLVVYKEDGTIYYDFGTSASSFYISTSLHKVGNDYRIYVDRYLFDEDNKAARYYDIYQIDKNASTGLQVVERSANAYPNPASSEINLPLEGNSRYIKIIDLSGRIIQTCPVYGEEMYQLNVSDYPSGVYFYEAGGKAKSFIVK